MGNAESQIIDDTAFEDSSTSGETIPQPAETQFESTENIVENPRKRKASPMVETSTTSPNPSENPNPRSDDSTSEELSVDKEPPPKKQRTDGPAAILDSEPILLEERLYPCLLPTPTSGPLHSSWDEDPATTFELLSTYIKPLPVTSIQLENLITKPVDVDWKSELRSPKIIAVIDEGVNEILKIFKGVGIVEDTIEKQVEPTATAPFSEVDLVHIGVTDEIDIEGSKITAEVGAETDSGTNPEPFSSPVKILEERITVLHKTKEILQSTVLHTSEDLFKAKADIKKLESNYEQEKQQFEARMNTSFNKMWNEQVIVLNRHKKKIIEDAKLNQTNRDWLVKVKTRLKEKIQEIERQRIELRETMRRVEMESEKLEEEAKENEKVQDRLRIKERNECWMLMKLNRQDNTLERFQEEKMEWEKERAILGIELRKLKAELAQAQKENTDVTLSFKEPERDPKD